MASVCIQHQLDAMVEEDSKNVVTEECHVTEFLSSVSNALWHSVTIIVTTCR